MKILDSIDSGIAPWYTNWSPAGLHAVDKNS